MLHDSDQLAPTAKSLTQLRVLTLSSYLHGFLQHPHTGTTGATFNRSCYLDLDGQIVALVAADLLNGPINIVLDVPPKMSFHRLRVGTVVASTPTALSTDEGLRVTLDSARPWDAALTPWTKVDETTLNANLALTRALLLAKAPRESFARHLAALNGRERTQRVGRSEPRALVAMANFLTGMQRSDLAAVSEATRQLVGLGSGLTPSGDDILVGALIALTIRPPTVAAPLRIAIDAAATGRSTRISEAYLEAAARGEASETWHRLLAVLPTTDSSALIPAVRRVMTFGETSGADMLAGFLLALGARRS